jgi:hypothetical protein
MFLKMFNGSMFNGKFGKMFLPKMFLNEKGFQIMYDFIRNIILFE